ncbi:MAG: tetratricopeptide repeat protein, partial [Spirochaetia bacterium]|nr:tetratricopeptide repeat protein [Spirochaetia bacterium]
MKIRTCKQAASLMLLVVCAGAGPIRAADKKYYSEQWPKLEKAGKFQEAVTLFQQATREYPKEAWFHVYLGHSLRKLNRTADSIPSYEAAMLISPNDKGIRRNASSPFYDYGWSLQKQGRTEEAERYLRRSSEITIYSVHAAGFARFLAERKRFDDAVKAFAHAVELFNATDRKPEDMDRFLKSYEEMLTALVKGKDAAHLRELVKIVGKDIQDDAVELASVRALLALGQSDEAAAEAQKIKNQTFRKLAKAEEAVAQGKLAEADVLYSEAFEAAPLDYKTPAAAARTLANRVRLLPDFGSRPEAQLSTKYAQLAFDRFIHQNPYKQSRKFSAPLKGSFRFGRGHGHLGDYGSVYALDMYYTGVENQMGRPVYAAADGIVKKVEDSHPDNAIGVKYKNV